MRINNNIMAMNAHRQYGINNSKIAGSTEKLSSGFRINRAGDDAAGLAISEKMRAQIRGLTMASKNSQDAISLVQTAEGALQETHNILQRMRELAVQSSSDTNEQTIDRGALEQEFVQLKLEIDDIASKTRFNDQNLIDGTFQKYRNSVNAADTAAGGWSGIMVDAANAGSYTVSFTAVAATTTAADVGAQAAVVEDGGKLSAAAGDGDVDNDTTGLKGTFTAAFTGEHNGMKYTVETFGEKASEMTFVLRNSLGEEIARSEKQDLTGLNAGGKTITFSGIGDLKLEGVAGGTFSDDITGASTLKSLINGAKYDFDDAGKNPKPASSTPGAIDIKIGAETVRVGLGDTSAKFRDSGIMLEFAKISDADIATPGDKFTGGALVIDQLTGKSMIIQTGANQNDELSINIDAMNTGKLGISYSSIKTQEAASKAITEVNDAVNQVSTQRAALGALQNRLNHKIANLDTSAENLQAAESRIRDVDMAKEMTTFTKNNILFQASTAMLAQANAAPQGVLQLLG